MQNNKNSEGSLTLLECEETLKQFKINKSPGNDGLTAEFYKVFWAKLGQHFLECYEKAYKEGELTVSQRQAIIKLLEKKDKDRLYLKN